MIFQSRICSSFKNIEIVFAFQTNNKKNILCLEDKSKKKIWNKKILKQPLQKLYKNYQIFKNL